jgi:hypothetical protein
LSTSTSTWRHRAPDSPALVQRTSAEAPSHAQHLRWAVEEDADGDCRRAAVQEEWKPLRQRLGAAHVRSGYELSNLGRLRNANGDTTRGFWFDNRRWAGTADGLIDLTTAAKLIPNVVTTTPRIEEAVEVLLGGGTPADLAMRGIAHSTAWYYCSKALELLSAPERKAVGRRIVHRHIWNALLDLRGDSRLGGKLNDLWPIVEQSIPSRSDILDDEHRMSHLRFGRMCMA